MKCAGCGAESPDSAAFCSGCGARLSAVCPSCGVANAPTHNFCHGCGTRLTTSPSAPAPTVPPIRAVPDRFASPQSYTPKHLVEKILTSRSAIVGERKQVSVLFTDVSGFTAMSERLDPEDVHAIMDKMFEVLLAAVHRYEGTVNQFLGDGMMALFGAPIAHEDHAQRALRAALSIQRELEPLREEVARMHGVAFRVRIGLNTGPVVVGAIGRDLRMDYTAVGDTTNLAARLLNLAKPGQIVASDHTSALGEGFFVFEDLGEFTIKGKTMPVRALAVTDERRGRTRLEVSRERGLTPFAGREHELERLIAAYRRAETGEGAVVWLGGEPGVGKSRLLHEFSCTLDPSLVLELDANCPSYGRSIPYQPILEMLRMFAHVDEEMAGPDVEERVRDLLRDLGIEDDEAEALLTHFLGVPVSSEFLVRLQGPELKQRTFRLLVAMILNASERFRPTVIVIENVHWADDSSLEFLRQLAAATRGHRVLLLLTSRLEFAPAWRETACTDTLTLGGLVGDDVARMVATLLGAPEVSTPLLEMLLDKGAGNPLYLEEIVRQLQETSAVRVEGGHVHLENRGITVPETIHDIIAARIDRLEEPLKQTLQPAAVVGRQFAVSLVSRVLHTEGETLPRLGKLHALDFVFPSDLDREPTYTFKHALTQEVVYAGLLERRRREYHAEIATALEEMHATRLDDVVELLAYHYGRSGCDEQAVDFAIMAAGKAQRRWAGAEALAYFDAALKRLAAMPDTAPNRLRRLDAVVKQAEIKFALGRHAEHVQALEAIRGLIAEADPPRRAAWLYWAGFFHSLTGARAEIPIAYCNEAVALADLCGLDDIRAYAECCLAHVYVVAGRLREAVATGERALAFFESQGNLWWACRTLWVLGMTCNALGDWAQSLGYCRQSLDHGLALDDRRLKVVGWWRTGSTLIQRGEAEEGVRCCDEALALAPSPIDEAMARGMRGYGLVKAGKADAGIAELEDVSAWLAKSNLPYTRTVVSLFLAEGYLHQHERRRARSLVESTLAVCKELTYPHVEGVAERLLGECLASEDATAALAHLQRAREILESIDARNDLAKALVAEAEIRSRAGDGASARALVERALTTFEALGTIDGPDRARRLLARLTTP